MGIAITFRHMDSSDAVKSYVHDKLERTQKYLRAPLEGHVTLFPERHHFVAEIHIHSTGKTYTARHESDDMYKSIDLAADKIEQQISKAHDSTARNKKGAPRAGEFASASGAGGRNSRR